MKTTQETLQFTFRPRYNNSYDDKNVELFYFDKSTKQRFFKRKDLKKKESRQDSPEKDHI